MKLAELAFKGLYPEKKFDFQAKLAYSGKFRGFNANIRLRGKEMVVGMSRNWKPVSADIKIGLIQSLMARLFRENASTLNMELYNSFLRQVHLAVPKTKTDTVLREAFSRVNSSYFYGLIELPNLAWNNSTRCLGSYDYGSDTVRISRVLAGNSELLDYVMYHELLHKKQKFRAKNGKCYHHTKEFRQAEKSFPSSAILEKKLSQLVRKAGLKHAFKWFFH